MKQSMAAIASPHFKYLNRSPYTWGEEFTVVGHYADRLSFLPLFAATHPSAQILDRTYNCTTRFWGVATLGSNGEIWWGTFKTAIRLNMQMFDECSEIYKNFRAGLVVGKLSWNRATWATNDATAIACIKILQTPWELKIWVNDKYNTQNSALCFIS